MKKFHFSLEKLLELREFEEDTAKMALAKAVSDCELLKRELEHIAVERVETNHLREGVSDALYMQAIEQYILRLDARKEELVEEIARAELVVEEKRALYAEAMQKRKVITNLREKQYEVFKKEARKAEESAVDDIVTSRFARA